MARQTWKKQEIRELIWDKVKEAMADEEYIIRMEEAMGDFIQHRVDQALKFGIGPHGISRILLCELESFDPTDHLVPVVADVLDTMVYER